MGDLPAGQSYHLVGQYCVPLHLPGGLRMGQLQGATGLGGARRGEEGTRENSWSCCLALPCIPFWTMGRVLYVHHYYPALLFSSMLTGVLIDYLLEKMCRLCPASLSGTVRHVTLGLIVGAACYTFYLFSPLVYGMSGTEGYARETNSTIHHLHWLSTWEF